MISADFHIHTNYSVDGSSSMEEMIKAAIGKKLKYIALTDHVDFIFPQPITDYSVYLEQLQRLQEKYKSKITIAFGVELGLGPFVNNKNKEFAGKYPFDFIIGSSHDVDGKDLYVGEYFNGKDKDTAYTGYFEEILKNIEECDFFSVYGHLDVIIRYGVYSSNFIRGGQYKDIIDEILRQLIKRDKGIEVNTSGFRYGLGQTHPSFDILKRYRELGGSIITAGSDAHNVRNVAEQFSELKQLLEQAGFREICVFKNMKPTFIKI